MFKMFRKAKEVKTVTEEEYIELVKKAYLDGTIGLFEAYSRLEEMDIDLEVMNGLPNRGLLNR